MTAIDRMGLGADGKSQARRAIAVSGTVQGVGFRPFVYDLASQLGLRGFVRNQTGGVLIEVEGEPDSLDRFLVELRLAGPPLARIDEVRWTSRMPRGDSAFTIHPSKDSERIRTRLPDELGREASRQRLP